MGTTETNQSLEAIKKVLDKGFELSFKIDCSQCVASGGSCGFKQSSKAFVCYCKDQPHEHTCGKMGNGL
ncbi:hypothetical protein ARALYDRAFT_916535 [Arabidopsis lyrata subsp. lyrata]|uniref:Wall-associated receptor kinase C-terminal domain-containing protein n=1 Tax=Arabidopsis lyrata subsp. lyrata TaxID=81972 RepID=D7MK26_ARALL|nr:hypothetical protein ARALYDRAFT_916535 [Arabidopsis lyrata subsp. lyrata]